MVSMTTRRRFVLGAVTAPFVARSARAQAFPSRPVRIVIGFPPGGGIDIDGHTILFGTAGNLAINQVLYPDRPGTNMERDFTPLSLVASLGFVLVVGPSMKVTSFKELIDFAKPRPG